MPTDRYSNQNCPIAKTLGVLGDRWSMLIVRDALMGVSRFKQFQSSLGASRNILARRLQQLVTDGLLEQQPVKTGAKHQRYIPTLKCMELAPVLLAMIDWGEKWYPHPNGRRFMMTDSQGGQIGVKACRESDGSPVELASIAIVKGPAADPD